ncbi:MAG: hypothetical protein ACKVOR_08085 [Flavobacteriales bacterium]
MRRAMYIGNLVLVIATAVGAFTIYFGLLGLLALGVVQPICSIIYWVQWRTLSDNTKRHLRNYLFMLGLSILIMIGIPVGDALNINVSNDLENVLLVLGLIGVSGMAIYFTFIAYIVSKDRVRKVIETDGDVLDADLIDSL